MYTLSALLTIGAAISTVSGASIHHAHADFHAKRLAPTLSPGYQPRAVKNTTFHLLAAAGAKYNLVDNYDHTNFFSTWNFFTQSDPTHGFVNYLGQSDAMNRGLAGTPNNQVRLGVDSTTVNPPSPGRASTRVTSNKAYTHGLFIADIAHMPGSDCGVWPAFWTFGPNWPASGEIDIIEGVNTATYDSVTLHTTASCIINNAGSQGGITTASTDCNSNNGYNGCSVTSSGQNYGSAFNNQGGGVYAMQWESSGVYVWFWPRNSIPANVQNGNPDPSTWGLPMVAFNSAGCNFDQHFANHNIVFDTTFCGDWAGAVFSQTCGQYGSCQSYVAGNPGAFADAYWLINSVKVYHL